ncbi:hypothetical protein ABZX92_12625 [Lentzea sp. NPDC006480]|uniref:hypothetical protein n=1 Tax=Lentzea sp. NPDC006480 TaxID=3157176 RepID=UPI0033ACB6DF
MFNSLAESLRRVQCRLQILYEDDRGYVSETALVTALLIGLGVALVALLGPAVLELANGIVAKLKA